MQMPMFYAYAFMRTAISQSTEFLRKADCVCMCVWGCVCIMNRVEICRKGRKTEIEF